MEVHAPPHWSCVDFISDLHLHAAQPDTLQALKAYLARSPANALMVLGDLFEAWVGDDMLRCGSFESECARVLQQDSTTRAIFLMPGNRDFLMGPDLLQACGAQALSDPSVLVLGGQRWVLSHGDALCTDDQPYQRFRAQVRSAQWQQAFLARPLDERLALARAMRQQSASAQQQLSHYADVDADQASALLRTHAAQQLIHGHTHRPGLHLLTGPDSRVPLSRAVLSDWEPAAPKPRGDVLRLHRAADSTWQLQRLDLQGQPLQLA